METIGRPSITRVNCQNVPGQTEAMRLCSCREYLDWLQRVSEEPIPLDRDGFVRSSVQDRWDAELRAMGLPFRVNRKATELDPRVLTLEYVP